MKKLLIIFLFSIPSFAGSWQAAYLFDFYSTTANYDVNDEKEDLSSGNFYELYKQRLDLYYRHKSNLRFLFGSELNYARSSDNVDERTNFQLNTINFGLEWEMHTDYGSFSLGNNNHLSVFKVDQATDEVIAGEGANLIHLYGIYRHQIGKRIGLYTKFGYQVRDEGRANLSTYEASLRLITMPLMLSLGVEGYHSVTDDEFVQTQVTRDNVTTNVNGGSFHYYSVNPSRLDLVIWGNYSFHHNWAGRIGYKSSLQGNNSSAGSSIFINLYRNFGGNDYANEELGIRGYAIDGEGEFQIIVDEYVEEEYFKAEKKKPKKKRKKRRRRPRKKSIDDEY